VLILDDLAGRVKDPEVPPVRPLRSTLQAPHEIIRGTFNQDGNPIFDGDPV
jgi:hypothetical protein